MDEEFGEKISKSLEQALGLKVMNVVYAMLKREFGIHKDEIATNPGALEEVLGRLFGPTGVDFLERLISREIVAEFDLALEPEEKDSTLSEVLRKARQKVYSD